MLKNLLSLLVMLTSTALSGQKLLHDVTPGPPITNAPGWLVSVRSTGSQAFYLAATGFESGVWRTDGTQKGTYMVRAYPHLPYASNQLKTVGSRVCWWEQGNRCSPIWVSDGTVKGTHALQVPAYLSAAPVSSGRLVYWISEGFIWVSDGRPASNRKVTPHVAGDILIAKDGRAFISRWRAGSPSRRNLIQITSKGKQLTPIVNRTGVITKSFDLAPVALGKDIFILGKTTTSWGLYRIRGASLTLVVGGLIKDEQTPGSLTVVGKRLFFTAGTPALGQELWSSDGTPAGTLPIDINPGTAGSGPGELTACNRKLFFFANNGTSGYEIWTSDGTAKGTRLVRDIYVGTQPTQIDFGPRHSCCSGKTLYFSATDGVIGHELWKSDGTTKGTVLVRDIAVGRTASSPGGGYWGRRYSTVRRIPDIVDLGGRVLFPADDGKVGFELWVSKGNASGTKLVADVHKGTTDSLMLEAVRSGDHAWFTIVGPNNVSLWHTDGVRTKPIYTTSGRGGGAGPLQGMQGLGDGRIVFQDLSQAKASGVWVAGPAQNPTLIKTGMAQVIGSAPGVVFFRDQVGLMATDGTTAGTRNVVADLTVFWWLQGDDRIWVVGKRAWRWEIWVTDGTARGTQHVAVPVGPVTGFFRGAGVLYFAAGESRNEQLLKTDGRVVSPATELINAGFLPRTYYPTVLGKLVFIPLGSKLMCTDGTTKGTRSLGAFWSQLYPIVASGKRVFFMADDGVHGVELWTSEGTLATTRLVKDINPGRVGSSYTVWPRITPLGSGGKVLFAARDVAHGDELWVSDGTAAGTKLVADINPGIGGSHPGFFRYTSLAPICRVGKAILFGAWHPTFGFEPFTVDLADFDVPLVERIETGCPGTASLVPTIEANGLPVLGNNTFGLSMGNARAASTYALGLAFKRSPWRLGGCTLQMTQPVAILLGATNAQGQAALTSGIPNVVSSLNVEVIAQFAVADPAGAWFGTMSLTPGLRMVAGR